MPRHQDQRDVVLTETGRQADSTGVHVLHVRYASDSDTPGLNAETKFDVLVDNTDGDETTLNQITLKKPDGTLIGLLSWKRTVDMKTPTDGPGRQVLFPEFHDPAPGNGAAAADTLVESWAPVLDSGPLGGSPTWTFTFELRFTSASTSRKVVVTRLVATKNARRWLIEGKDSSGVLYTAHLSVLVATSPSETGTPVAFQAFAVGAKRGKRTANARAAKATPATRKRAPQRTVNRGGARS